VVEGTWEHTGHLCNTSGGATSFPSGHLFDNTQTREIRLDVAEVRVRCRCGCRCLARGRNGGKKKDLGSLNVESIARTLADTSAGQALGLNLKSRAVLGASARLACYSDNLPATKRSLPAR
jgi:hypothetical protein